MGNHWPSLYKVAGASGADVPLLVRMFLSTKLLGIDEHDRFCMSKSSRVNARLPLLIRCRPLRTINLSGFQCVVDEEYECWIVSAVICENCYKEITIQNICCFAISPDLSILLKQSPLGESKLCVR